jgi:hypothetical protein
MIILLSKRLASIALVAKYFGPLPIARSDAMASRPYRDSDGWNSPLLTYSGFRGRFRPHTLAPSYLPLILMNWRTEMNTTQIIMSSLAAALGVYYSVLGFTAIKYLHHPDQIDKAVGWTLWWCLDIRRYDEKGRALCKQGQLISFSCIALWIAVYATHSTQSG